MEQQEQERHWGIIDPDYARVFTKARILAWQYGYSCCVQGSFTRDLDLLLVPWEERACVPAAEVIVKRLAETEGLKLQGEPSVKPHGRKSWTLLFPEFGDPRWVDIAVFFPAERQELDLEKARTALEFYKEEAEAIAKNLEANKLGAVEASMVILQRDAGRRANEALGTKDEGENGTAAETQ